ncbi:MAG: DUF4331 domain-containing protein [Acidobacteria bacterium]|nr:DUF4331 domain-containing protein [Acidobacteriota bacterium]
MKNRVLFLTLLVILVVLPMLPGRASSHREAPLISGDPQVDTTDVYAFVSPDRPDTVTLISSWIPFEDPAGGPNFYKFSDNALYEFKIDNNGDGVEDITYQFRFTSQVRNPNTFLYGTGPITSLDHPNRNFLQTYTVTQVDASGSRFLGGPFLTMPDNVGKATTPNYGGNGSGIYTFNIPGDGTGLAFAGQTDDAFFLDLRIFDLLYGADLSEVGTDSLAGFNVHSIAIQVPKSVIRGGNPIVAVWATASRPAVTTRSVGGETNTGAFVQVSRLGAPLVNEVVIPVGQKDRWNGSRPVDDGQFASYVTNPEVPVLLNAVYGVPIPATPRNDLVAAFLTGVAGLNQPPGGRPYEALRLNTDVLPTAAPHRMGVVGGDPQGFPNGRRLTDDVLDIAVQAMAGVLLGVNTGLGDGVDRNDVPFRTSFPYVAFPHAGSRPWKLNPQPPAGH